MADDLTEALENTVLVLYAPRLPEATAPVVGAHAGVPLRIYDLAPMGATVEVDPYLGQQPGDTVTLNLNGQPGIDSQQTASNSSTTTLYIPKKLLLPDITNRLTYSVTRNSQNIGTSEPPLELLYNAIRPGNQDTNPGEDGHSRLDLLLPDAIKHGVGPDFPVAGAQVCVSYPYCRACDRIRLNCNGHDVFHTVTTLQAPNPGSDEPVTVCFTVTRADLESAKDHPQFKFSYTVTDQLGNGPDTDSPWSATQIVDVDLTGNRLPTPILREIQNDPTDEPGIIDLEKLGKNPLLQIVLTNDPRFAPGDTLTATYTAKVTGQPDVVVTVSGIVEADEFGQKKPCVLQVANDQVIAGSVVTATYQLLRNGTVLGSSRMASARVIGEGLPDLTPPRLQKAVNGVLDPLDAANLQGANGQVEVLGYRKGDTVQLIVEGAPGAGSPTFTPLPLNANSRANFPLTKAFIAANMGKQVKLHYLLIRDGKPLPSSPILTASVGTIPDGHPSLPTPAIDRAPGSELDVTQLQAADQLRVGEWPHQVPGQTVWLRYEGFDANGGAIFYDDRKGEPHDSASGLARPAPITWLKTLEDGSELTILFRVNFDGVLNAQTATTFPNKVYRVKAVALITPTIDSVKDTKDIEIPQDGTTTDTTVTLAGKATGNLQVEIFDGTTSKGTAQVNANGDWTKQVTGLTAAAHSFTAKGLYGSNPVSAPPRTLTVDQPLVVDTSTMILDGVAVYVNGWVESGNIIENNTKTRQPTSGTPEYTYQSSDPTIVQVTGDGSVTGRRNGTAIIKVLDASGQSAEYDVQVTNVYKIVLNNTLLTPDQATAWARSQGHINLEPLNDVTRKILIAFSRTYGMQPNPNLHLFPRMEGIDYPTASNPPSIQAYGWIAQTYVVNVQGGKMCDGLASYSQRGSAITGANLYSIFGQSAPPFITYSTNAWFNTRSGAYALLRT